MRNAPFARSCCCAVFIFAALAHLGTLHAQENSGEQPQLTEESRQLGEFLFSALKNSREKLRSGVCRIHETTRLTRRTGETIDIAAEIFCAFDYEKGLLRFDREDSQSGETKRFFRTPEQSVLYSTETQHLFVMAPSEEVTKKYSVQPLDARAFGMASLSEYRSGWTFSKLFDLYTRKAELADAQRAQNGEFQIVLSHAPSETLVIQRHLQLDGEKDYVPVHYHYRYFNKKTDEWSGPLSAVDTTWSKKAEVWVPDTIHAVKGTGDRAVSDLTFTWETVNEELPESLFEKDSLKAKDGTRIVDVRLGDNKPVILGKVGEKSGIGPDELESDKGSRLTTVILINAIIIALVLVFLFWRHLKSGPETPTTGG